MAQTTFAASQSLLNFAERFGLRELAETHRHKLIPTTEAFCSLLSSGALDRGSKLAAINQT